MNKKLKINPLLKEDLKDQTMEERKDPAGFTKDYLQRTSLHGLQYIGENNRTVLERVFWALSFSFGMFCASYFTLALWDKWESSPVYMSVETTSLPVPTIPFPAISICSVNKLEERRLMKALEKMMESTEEYANQPFEMETIYRMLEWFIRYDTVNISGLSPQDQEMRSQVSSAHMLKLFKSAMPPCKKMLAYCSWMGEETSCLRLFKVMTTDDGFCCVFNAYSPKDVFKLEAYKSSAEYDFLDDSEFVEIVCDDPDDTSCTPGFEGGGGDDEHWEPRSDRTASNRRKRAAGNGTGRTVIPPLSVPQHAYGAGSSTGLTVMLIANLDKYFLSSAFFEGFKVLVHHPEEFPNVRDRGFVLGPGSEMFAQVKATDVYATSSIRGISVDKRQCQFSDEGSLKHFQNYTRSNCLLECAHEAMMKLCGCQPYFYPFRTDNMTICDLTKVECMQKYAVDLKMLAFPTDDMKEEWDKFGIEQCDCPSSCSELTYSVTSSAVPYPSDLGYQSDVLQRVLKKAGPGMKREWMMEETSLLHIFYENEFLIQYKRDSLYGINDFISNIGGLMGLCMGFSVLSCIELGYWFIVRWVILITRGKRN